MSIAIEQITETAAQLTKSGRAFMTMVGQRKFDFFDGGIVAGEGNWGEQMSWQLAEAGVGKSVKSAAGIMTATKKLGLWETHEDDAKTWWSLTELGAEVANTLADAEEEALPGEELFTNHNCIDVVDQPEEEAQTPEATKEWRGNYNTVFVPVAEEVAAAFPDALVWVENVSAMLRCTHAAGPGAADFVARLEELEGAALPALRTWQKASAESRRGLTEMQKYNQHRAFLSGYGQAVAARLAGKKVARRPVAFAKDMEKAMVDAEQAFAAGKLAGKDAQ